MQGTRAGNPVPRQMVGVAEKEWQIANIGPAFKNRQNQMGAIGKDMKIRILDPLQNSLMPDICACIIKGKHITNLIITKGGKDSHRSIRKAEAPVGQDL